MTLLFTIIFTTMLGLVIGQSPIYGFRPPSVPLVVMDPYMNIWSMAEQLYDTWSSYWTEDHKTFAGIIRIDGDVYHFMGSDSGLISTDAMLQQSVTVWPTRTIYQFQDPIGRIDLSVQFTTPALPKQWDISSRPVTYITYNVTSVDERLHDVQLYYDNHAQLAANTYDQEVTWSRFEVSSSGQVFNVMQTGTVSQNYLGTTGDGVGIDWGYAYVAVAQEALASTVITGWVSATAAFVNGSTLPSNDDTPPRQCQDDWPVCAVAWNFSVDGSSSVTKFVTFAYDDYYSIEYFGHRFQPYWRRPALDATIETLLISAITEYPSLLQQCEDFDIQLVRDMEIKGGDEYATLAALAYRQTMAGTKLVWNDQLQTPWVFFKEISNSGSLSTVNVMAAASPFFLYNDPAFLELSLLPILAYANNETGNAEYNYSLSWAPHHLGTYPVANIHSDQQENMPMEETGNMLIMLAAITQKLGIGSTSQWYPRYWPLLQSWADYLVSTLPDPPDQLCTDDFEGSSPHNANLAIKGIVGLGAFAELCRIVGVYNDYDYYAGLASDFAEMWVIMANDSDHYRLQYDLAGTWSLKYNLLFDKVLDLGLFEPDVATTELSYYLNYHFNPYGIPLDNRATFAKLDWTAWVAAISSDRNQQIQIFQVLYNWANMAMDMMPLSDWYDTFSGHRNNYTARPVVGGLYALMIV